LAKDAVKLKTQVSSMKAETPPSARGWGMNTA
jgi:hypothetical protein